MKTGHEAPTALPAWEALVEHHRSIEKLQLLKLDFLGLTNLTILGRAVELIREHRGETIELTALPDGDPAVAVRCLDPLDEAILIDARAAGGASVSQKEDRVDVLVGHRLDEGRV